MTKAGQCGAIRAVKIRRDLLAILANSEWWDVDGVEIGAETACEKRCFTPINLLRTQALAR